MAYLTLVNSNHPATDKIVEEFKGYRVEGLYDYLVISQNPTDLLTSLRLMPASSITLKTNGYLPKIKKFNTLMITRPDSETEFTKTKGNYDSFHTSDSYELPDILTMPDVKGYLEFELAEVDKIQVNNSDTQLFGHHYVPTSRPKTAEPKDIDEYLDAGRFLAETVSEFNPTLIYAPVRGAHPITSAILWHMDKPIRTYFPVTSSFVKEGRLNNQTEISRLSDFNKYLERFLYVEEMVSGGMTRGHLKEIMHVLGDRVAANDSEVKTVGIVHKNGDKLNSSLRSMFDIMEKQGDMHIERVNNLFTLDDNEFLGLHYINYGLGPHSVPFLEEGDYPQK